ncbi:MAG: purine-nucleoside phosphorylase [Bacteroidota bacterium]
MLYEQAVEAAQFIQSKWKTQPLVGLILGTGLSGLADLIEDSVVIPYEDIPHFPASTVSSHKGQLVLGHLEGKPVVAMAGRFHYYEGYSMKQVTFPVRVMKLLGVLSLFVSNAAGSVNAEMLAGDLVVLKDHINLQPENPLRGENDERFGLRFPDMMKTYDAALRRQAFEIAEAEGIKLQEGIYVGLQGPNLETPAEYLYMHRIGGDLVGMSTVPEVIVARHMDLAVFALSVVSNQCHPPEVIKETTLEEVIEVVEGVALQMQLLVRKLVERLPA